MTVESKMFVGSHNGFCLLCRECATKEQVERLLQPKLSYDKKNSYKTFYHFPRRFRTVWRLSNILKKFFSYKLEHDSACLLMKLFVFLMSE